MFKQLSMALLVAGACVSLPVRAQSEISALSAASALPVASVVVGASVAAGTLVAIPVMLSTAGSVLVRAVDVSARGTVYVLERASDGARVSVEVVGRAATGASVAAGTLVTVSVVSAGVILSAAGEVVAFVPNAIGQALLHNQRLSY